MTPTVLMPYSYRPLSNIDTAAFGRNILRLELFNSSMTDADDHAELFNTAVKCILNIHTPLRMANMTMPLVRQGMPCEASSLNV